MSSRRRQETGDRRDDLTSHVSRHATYEMLRYNTRTSERFDDSNAMIQRSIQFCHACGSRATPRALYCVDCGARLAPTSRSSRTPRPAGVRVGGRYRLRRLIDMGGNGAVYEAQHELLGTTHALKESLASDLPSLEQFLVEARLMGGLDHPVLVRVSDYFIEPSGAAFLVMDYVSGETLQHKLEQPVASYSVSDVISWLLQLCSALEYLHSYRD